MDWAQTLTIIGTILPGIAAFYYIVKKDLDRHDAEISEVRKEMRAEFSETRKLWSGLLDKTYKLEQEIYKIGQEVKDIKLFVVSTLPTKEKK